MKRKKLLHAIVVTALLLPVALSGIALTCSSEELATLIFLGFFFLGGSTDFRITLGGLFDYSSWTNPISSGEEIPDATITATNETTMSSTTYTYNPPAGGHMGYYFGSISYSAGDFISSHIEANNHVLNGASTQVPDSSASITSSGGSQTQPYSLTWSITPGTYPASHTMIWVDHFSLGVNSWYVVPVSQVSFTLDGFPSGSGYSVSVYLVNEMPFANQGSSFDGRGYLGSTAAPAAITLDF